MQRRERIFPDVSQLFRRVSRDAFLSSVIKSMDTQQFYLVRERRHISTLSLSIPHLRILESAIYSSFTQLYGDLQDVPE